MAPERTREQEKKYLKRFIRERSQELEDLENPPVSQTSTQKSGEVVTGQPVSNPPVHQTPPQSIFQNAQTIETPATSSTPSSSQPATPFEQTIPENIPPSSASSAPKITPSQPSTPAAPDPTQTVRVQRPAPGMPPQTPPSRPPTPVTSPNPVNTGPATPPQIPKSPAQAPATPTQKPAEVNPKAPEEEAVKNDINNLPEKDKKSFFKKLSVIGLNIEKTKDDWFAKGFQKIINGDKKFKIKGFGENSTVGRFCAELRDSYLRDSATAKQKKEDVLTGKEKHRMSNIAGLGNLIKVGRFIADATGLTVGAASRLAMTGGMVLARGAEAGKETRLKRHEVREKTWGKKDDKANAERAAEEAWKIYENAKSKSVDGVVSADALKNAYLMEMPKDLQERIKRPSTGNSFIQKVLQVDLLEVIGRLNTSVNKIENDSKLSEKEKEIKIQKLLNGQKKNLDDYDRVISQYGTVDGWAMTGYYAQTAGKTIVAAMQVETLVLSLEKMYGALSHIITSHNVHETLGAKIGGRGFSGPRGASGASGAPGHSGTEAPTGVKGGSGAFGHTGAEGSSGAHGATAASGEHAAETAAKPVVPAQETPTTAPDHPATVAPKVEAPKIETPATENSGEIKLDDIRVVHKGEGIEHTLIRQIEKDPELAKNLGFKEGMDLHKFAGSQAHKIAFDKGYVDNAGHEVRINAPDKVAFDLKVGADGNTIVDEKTLDGNSVGEYRDHHLSFGKNAHNQYEYEKTVTPPTEHTSLNVSDVHTTEAPHEFLKTPPPPELPAEDLPRPVNPHDYTPLSEAQDLPTSNHIDAIENTRAKVLEQLTVHGDHGAAPTAPDTSHLEHAVQSSSADVGILKSHPEFAQNPFKLSNQELLEVYKTHELKLHQIFPDNTEKNWAYTKNFDAFKMIHNTKGETDTAKGFVAYIQKIQKISGVEPVKGGFFRRAESVQHYLAKAMQSMEKKHQLGLLK